MTFLQIKRSIDNQLQTRNMFFIPADYLLYDIINT